MAFLKLIRWPNLLIVILTQYLFYWLIRQLFQACHIQTSLDFIHFSLLVFTTVIIAASAYIINDLLDYKIDQINKADSMVLGRSISISQAKTAYGLFVVYGALVAIYLAIYVDQPVLFLIYPSAIILMFLYSRYWKQRPLSGNVVVALFSAFVPGIVWFAERSGFEELPTDIGKQMSGLLLFYMFFAFISKC